MSRPALLFLLLLAAERLLELFVARRNERWIRSRGGVEVGIGLSRVIVLFHAAWFISFGLEAALRGGTLGIHSAWPFGALVLLQSMRYWCILSLGKFWNTKVLVLPGAAPVRRGPYRLMHHPNYLVVLIEIALYPALFGLWLTAILFGTANAWLLKKRIEGEDLALSSLSRTV